MSSSNKVYSILAGGYVDKPAPLRKRGSYDVSVIDRDQAGHIEKLRITSLTGEVDFDMAVTARDSQGRVLQLRVTAL